MGGQAQYSDGYWTSKDGLTLHYRDYAGSKSRPPIICIPGLTRNARDFEHVAKRLAGDWRVICVELRGRGESAYAKDPMTYVPATYVEDMELLLAELKIKKFVSISTSLGGLVTMLLAAAKHLSQHRHFDGTVYLVFQPAEEGGGGAREMIADGLFERFPMEAMFGLHNWPGLAVGQFAISNGPCFASSNEFHITIHGKGSHAAMPHLGIDPVLVACQMVQAFQTIITRNKRPVESGVISVTMVHAGEATNVVPDRCEIQGTVRTFTLEVLDLIEQRMQAIAEHTCAAFGARCEFAFRRNYPPTINHPAETAFARGVLSDLVGADNVLAFEPTMGAEDFSYFLQALPGAYFVMGNGDGEHRDGGHGLGPCTLHNPSYDFNDTLIPLGATAWVRLAERWLARAPG